MGNLRGRLFNIEGFDVRLGRCGSAVETAAGGVKLVVLVDTAADRGALTVKYKQFQPDADHVICGTPGGTKTSGRVRYKPSYLLIGVKYNAPGDQRLARPAFQRKVGLVPVRIRSIRYIGIDIRLAGLDGVGEYYIVNIGVYGYKVIKGDRHLDDVHGSRTGWIGRAVKVGI